MDSFTFTIAILGAVANIIIAIAILISVIKNNTKIDAIDKKVDGHLSGLLEALKSVAKPTIITDRRIPESEHKNGTT